MCDAFPDSSDVASLPTAVLELKSESSGRDISIFARAFHSVCIGRDASESQMAAVHQTIRHAIANDTMPIVDCVTMSVLSSVKIMTLAAKEIMLPAQEVSHARRRRQPRACDSRPHQERIRKAIKDSKRLMVEVRLVLLLHVGCLEITASESCITHD